MLRLDEDLEREGVGHTEFTAERAQGRPQGCLGGAQDAEVAAGHASSLGRGGQDGMPTKAVCGPTGSPPRHRDRHTDERRARADRVPASAQGPAYRRKVPARARRGPADRVAGRPARTPYAVAEPYPKEYPCSSCCPRPKERPPQRVALR
ncbi:hypothetical protein GCM10027075_32380 [Streptomyces heilongjiangensis]